jgi:hypothetical protein
MLAGPPRGGAHRGRRRDPEPDRRHHHLPSGFESWRMAREAFDKWLTFLEKWPGAASGSNCARCMWCAQCEHGSGGMLYSLEPSRKPGGTFSISLKLNDISSAEAPDASRPCARRSVFGVNKKPKSYGLFNRLDEVVKPELLEVFLVDDVLGKGTALGRTSKFLTG